MSIRYRRQIKDHINLLRNNSPDVDFRSIYDFDVYNNVFVEDIALFNKTVPYGQKVLDFGCGRGTTSYILAELGYDVTGLDVSYGDLDANLTSYVLPEQIQAPLWVATRAHSENDTLDFCFYDGDKVPFDDESYDAIFAYAVLEHVADLDATLRELKRILKPGGHLFVSRTPNKFSLLENIAKLFGIPAHENTYTKKEFEEYLNSTGFSVTKIELVDFFPSNLPGSLNKHYQKLYSLLIPLEKLVRYTPFNYFTHHLRVFAQRD